MKKALVAAVVVAVVIAMIGCSRSQRKAVTLAGSTAFQPFAEKLAERYLTSHKDVQVNVQGGGSAVGIQSALSGAAEIGMADLLELPPEAKALTATVVAKDGIAIVANPKNPLVNVTADQARDIFSGAVSNWKDLGGMDAQIRVISREDGSGTRRTFDKLVLGSTKLAPNALFQNSNGTIREAVASDPNAIGYISISLVSDKVKALSYNSVAPTNDGVKKGIYPLARPVFFLTKGEPSSQAKAFIDYVLSPESQAELEKEGLISAK